MRLNYKSTKRLIDILGAAFGLVILSPVLLLVAILIRLIMGKPVIFKQVRPGFTEKPFTIYKFRTMTEKRAQDGSLLPDKERLNKLGAFLRKSSIDELPELLNVLKGDMSLVGPRPLLMLYLPKYNPYERQRHEVKPGITGWAQIVGRNTSPWEAKMELDIWYINNRTFWVDIKIIIMTIVKVIRRDDIEGMRETTMPFFRGKD